MTTKTEVLMVGCGAMGGALLGRWLEQPGCRFTVVSPSGRQQPAPATVVRNAKALQDQRFDLIVFAVKPQMFADVLPDYTDLLKSGGCFASIAAGYSMSSIESLVGKKPLIRIMPNMPVSIGKGVSALFANPDVSDRHRKIVEKLMDETGKCFWVNSEDEIDRLTAIAGSGPGYVFEIARCWMQAGHSLGFPENQAREMVLQTLAGSAALALDTTSSLDELRDGVTSKGGTTAAGLAALNKDASLEKLLQQTLDAAYARATELR